MLIVYHAIQVHCNAALSKYRLLPLDGVRRVGAVVSTAIMYCDINISSPVPFISQVIRLDAYESKAIALQSGLTQE